MRAVDNAPQVEFKYVYPCPSSVEPLHDPPSAIKVNGRGVPSTSIKHFANPYFASDVLPIPGEPSNPKQCPFCSPVIHCAMIFFNWVLA